MRLLLKAVAAAAFAILALAPRAAPASEPHSGPPPLNWSGIYAGIHVGWGRLDVDRAYPIDDHYVMTGVPADQAPAGWLGGGQVGVNRQFGSTLIGAELSLAAADIAETGTFQGYPTDPPVRLATKMSNLFTATARLGGIHGSLLSYIKGGYAGAQITASSWDPAPHWSEVTHWTGGWTVGGGFELMIRPNLTWGVDYTYINFETRTHNGRVNGVGPGPPLFQNTQINAELHSVMARLNFKIGSW